MTQAELLLEFLNRTKLLLNLYPEPPTSFLACQKCLLKKLEIGTTQFYSKIHQCSELHPYIDSLSCFGINSDLVKFSEKLFSKNTDITWQLQFASDTLSVNTYHWIIKMGELIAAKGPEYWSQSYCKLTNFRPYLVRFTIKRIPEGAIPTHLRQSPWYWYYRNPQGQGIAYQIFHQEIDTVWGKKTQTKIIGEHLIRLAHLDIDSSLTECAESMFPELRLTQTPIQLTETFEQWKKKQRWETRFHILRTIQLIKLLRAENCWLDFWDICSRMDRYLVRHLFQYI